MLTLWHTGAQVRFLNGLNFQLVVGDASLKFIGHLEAEPRLQFHDPTGKTPLRSPEIRVVE